MRLHAEIFCRKSNLFRAKARIDMDHAVFGIREMCFNALVNIFGDEMGFLQAKVFANRYFDIYIKFCTKHTGFEHINAGNAWNGQNQLTDFLSG